MRFAILLMLLTSCVPSLYYVTTDSTFDEINNEPYKAKLIYLNPDMANLSKLDSIATIINKKKWKKLDASIKTFSIDDQRFLTSIKHLINEEYLISYNTLEPLDSRGHECQVKLLKTDCLYELGVDSVDFKSKYQDAMNCTHSEVIKSIIHTRYRFIKYGQ